MNGLKFIAIISFLLLIHSLVSAGSPFSKFLDPKPLAVPIYNTSATNVTYVPLSLYIDLYREVSVLEVVVIINSVLIVFLMLIVSILTAIRCLEDISKNPEDYRYDDPLWLKLLSVFSWVLGCLACQACWVLCAKDKEKSQEDILPIKRLRAWHKYDLDVQRGIIDPEKLLEERKLAEEKQAQLQQQ
ncbi:hypothetical protein ABK040_004893 [Willaertia magna]